MICVEPMAQIERTSIELSYKRERGETADEVDEGKTRTSPSTLRQAGS